ncbi:MAG: TetR/AcrR family transcriptional regulator [Actinomycetaceae bacterium]
MNTSAKGAPPPTPRAGGRLRADKRSAIMSGAREVFAHIGYERASVAAIASVSGVSTRTMYKHFADKSALFYAVVEETSARVAEDEITLLERHLSGVVRGDQVEPALLGFATEWLTGTAPSPEGRALIRQVRADTAQLGDDAVVAWWQAGPGRVIAELAAVLADWHRAGLLDAPHDERAALHLAELVAARPGPPGAHLAADAQREWIADGVRVFVRGHSPRPSRRATDDSD